MFRIKYVGWCHVCKYYGPEGGFYGYSDGTEGGTYGAITPNPRTISGKTGTVKVLCYFHFTKYKGCIMCLTEGY